MNWISIILLGNEAILIVYDEKVTPEEIDGDVETDAASLAALL